MAGRPALFLLHQLPLAMPYSKVDGSETDECDAGQVAVEKDADGEVMGCHDTEDEADDQIAALNASEKDMSDQKSRGENLGEALEAAVQDLAADSDDEPSDIEDEMAQQAGLDSSTVNDILNGEIQCPPMDRLEAFAEVLAVDTQVLVDAAMEDGCEYDMDGRASGQRTGSYRAVMPSANIRETADENKVTVQFMTEQVARDGMVLDAEGLDTDAFERNPVVLWSHGTDPRRGDEPIGKASNIRRNGDGMLADVEFANDEFAQRIKEKVEDGFVNAVSVGWRTQEMDTDGDAPTVTRSDMTEFSFVAVPADTEALVQERTAGSDVQRRIDQLEQEIEDLRAKATATSPPNEVDAKGTPDASAEKGRDESPRPSPRTATQQDYERLAGKIVPLIRTKIRKQLGKT